MQKIMYSGQAIWLFYRVSDRSRPAVTGPVMTAPAIGSWSHNGHDGGGHDGRWDGQS